MDPALCCWPQWAALLLGAAAALHWARAACARHAAPAPRAPPAPQRGPCPQWRAWHALAAPSTPCCCHETTAAHRGDGANPVVRGHLRALVRVQLHALDLVLVLGLDFVQHGRDHLAGPAPCERERIGVSRMQGLLLRRRAQACPGRPRPVTAALLHGWLARWGRQDGRGRGGSMQGKLTWRPEVHQHWHLQACRVSGAGHGGCHAWRRGARARSAGARRTATTHATTHRCLNHVLLERGVRHVRHGSASHTPLQPGLPHESPPARHARCCCRAGRGLAARALGQWRCERHLC